MEEEKNIDMLETAPNTSVKNNEFPKSLSFVEADELKVGDKIDHRDSVGRYVEAEIVDKMDTKLKIHYTGWAKKWDTWSDYSDYTELQRFATAHSISKRKNHRFPMATVDDWVRFYSKRHSEFLFGAIRRFDEYSGQIQVVYSSPRDDEHAHNTNNTDSNAAPARRKQWLYWLHLDNPKEVISWCSDNGNAEKLTLAQQYRQSLCLTDPSLHDVRFVVGKERTRITGVRAIMAACSPVFKAQLFGHFIEADPSVDVVLSTISERAFRCIQRYAHGLPISGNVLTLYEAKSAAAMYRIDGLAEFCISHIPRILDDDKEALCQLLHRLLMSGESNQSQFQTYPNNDNNNNNNNNNNNGTTVPTASSTEQSRSQLSVGLESEQTLIELCVTKLTQMPLNQLFFCDSFYKWDIALARFLRHLKYKSVWSDLKERFHKRALHEHMWLLLAVWGMASTKTLQLHINVIESGHKNIRKDEKDEYYFGKSLTPLAQKCDMKQFRRKIWPYLHIIDFEQFKSPTFFFNNVRCFDFLTAAQIIRIMDAMNGNKTGPNDGISSLTFPPFNSQPHTPTRHAPPTSDSDSCQIDTTTVQSSPHTIAAASTSATTTPVTISLEERRKIESAVVESSPNKNDNQCSVSLNLTFDDFLPLSINSKKFAVAAIQAAISTSTNKDGKLSIPSDVAEIADTISADIPDDISYEQSALEVMRRVSKWRSIDRRRAITAAATMAAIGCRNKKKRKLSEMIETDQSIVRRYDSLDDDDINNYDNGDDDDHSDVNHCNKRNKHS